MSVWGHVALWLCGLFLCVGFRPLHQSPSPNSPKSPVSSATNPSVSCARAVDCRFERVKVLRCIDGDTCFVRLPGRLPAVFQKIRVRIAGIDAAEMPKPFSKTSRPKAETDCAKRTRLRLNNWMRHARRVDLKACEEGKYFRLVCRMLADGKDVGKTLLREGYVVPYNGNRKPKRGWCQRFGDSGK